MIIAIKGVRNTGKTTFIEKLLEKLQGYQVVVIKSSEHERIDKKGKDSFRYRKAGSIASMMVMREESVIFMKPMELEEAISFVERKISPDFIIVEGNESIEKLKCRVVDMAEEPDLEQIYEDMVRSIKRRKMEIFVDGKKLPMNEFVEGLMYNTIKAMLSTLKRGEGGSVEIVMRE